MEANKIKELIHRMESLSIEQAMALLTDLFPGKVVFSTSLGQEDQVITQIVANNNLPVEIFTLDTGRLFYETYDLLARPIDSIMVCTSNLYIFGIHRRLQSLVRPKSASMDFSFHKKQDILFLRSKNGSTPQACLWKSLLSGLPDCGEPSPNRRNQCSCWYWILEAIEIWITILAMHMDHGWTCYPKLINHKIPYIPPARQGHLSVLVMLPLPGKERIWTWWKTHRPKECVMGSIPQ